MDSLISALDHRYYTAQMKTNDERATFDRQRQKLGYLEMRHYCGIYRTDDEIGSPWVLLESYSSFIAAHKKYVTQLPLARAKLTNGTSLYDFERSQLEEEVKDIEKEYEFQMYSYPINLAKKITGGLRYNEAHETLKRSGPLRLLSTDPTFLAFPEKTFTGAEYRHLLITYATRQQRLFEFLLTILLCVALTVTTTFSPDTASLCCFLAFSFFCAAINNHQVARLFFAITLWLVFAQHWLALAALLDFFLLSLVRLILAALRFFNVIYGTYYTKEERKRKLSL